MNKSIILVLLFLVSISFTACSDDDPVTPEQFSFTIEVVDPEGNPVSGLDMSLAADIPFYQDQKQSPAKASVKIPFFVAYPCSAKLSINDITGTKIRELFNGNRDPGYHYIMWDGVDDHGNRMASGVYTAHFVALDSDSANLLYDEQLPIYMAILDPARLSVGTTNADGQIKLTDKRLFPQLNDAPEIPALDENGQSIGTIQFTDSMRFQLVDLTNGGSYKFYENVTGTGSLRIVWDTSTKSSAVPVASRNDDAGTSLKRSENFYLGNPYPVPFN